MAQRLAENWSVGVYNVKSLDGAVTRVAGENRLLEQAMKATNARTAIESYDQEDAVSS